MVRAAWSVLLQAASSCCPARREWPYEKPAVEVKRRKPKGHKHDREKPQRWGRWAGGRATGAPPGAPPCQRQPCVHTVATVVAAHPMLLHLAPPSFPACREAEIQKKLELADKRIAEYRAAQHAPMREASLMDRILLTPSQIRQKAKGG